MNTSSLIAENLENRKSHPKFHKHDGTTANILGYFFPITCKNTRSHGLLLTVLFPTFTTTMLLPGHLCNMNLCSNSDDLLGMD